MIPIYHDRKYLTALTIGIKTSSIAKFLSKRETCNSYLLTSYDKYFTRVLNDAFHFLCCSPFFLLFIYVPFAFLSIVSLSSLVLRKTILSLIFKDESILIEGNGDVLIQSNVCLSQILS